MVGKLINNAAISQIEYYKRIANCVISCWDNDNLSLLDTVNLDGVTVVINSSAIPKISGPGTCYYQVTTANSALQKVNSLFTIKTRLDESFSNLSPLIELIEANPNKIVCGSPHFSKDSKILHAGDHFYGCKTETMKKGFAALKSELDNDLPEGQIFNNKNSMPITQIEQYITRALMYGNGETLFTKENAREIFIKNYEVCRIEKLGSVHYTETHGLGTKFFPDGTINKTGYTPCWQESNFDSINDLV
jgi:hypothetical protein